MTMTDPSGRKLSMIALIKFLDLIEEKQKWGKRTGWTNFHYSQLSKEMFEKTGQLVSYNTLKRIFGKINTSGQYTPRTSTLDILAKFLDYKNWGHYCDQLPKPEEKEFPETAPAKKTFLSRRRMAYYITMIGGLISVSFLTVVSFQHRFFETSIPLEIKVGSKNNAGNYLVTFVSPLKKEELKGFTFSFGDGSEVLLDSVYKNGKFEFFHAYTLAGYYKASVKSRGKNVQEFPVHIKTDGWQGALSLDNRHYRELQKHDFLTKSGRLQVDTNLLKIKLSFRQLAWGYSTRFYNYFDSDTGEPFRLETEFGFEHLSQSMFCEKIEIMVCGSESNLRLSFSQPGCISEASIKIGDHVLRGREDNLSAMGLNLYRLQKIIVSADGDVFDIISGDDLLYRLPYPNSIGKIKGIAFEFLGNGYLKSVKLENKNRKEIHTFL